MIKDIFLPRRYGSYYLFSSRIVGIEINATEVIATQLRAQGNSRIIEKIIIVPLVPGSQADHHAKAIDALRTALDKVDTYDTLVTVIPSSYVIFKRLTVPFTRREKIAQMINFEVEPLLPFPISSAIINFIITSIAPDNKSAEVMIAAAQEERIIRHISVFEAIGITPSIITVDLFCLYALTREIPLYADKPGIIALIHIGTNATGIAFMQNKHLIMTRTITKGTAQLAKSISTARSISVEMAMEELFRFGIDKSDNTARHEAIRSALRAYMQEIAFTFNSVTTDTMKVQTTLMLGAATHIPGLMPLATEILQTPCELFDITHIMQHPSIKLKPNVSLTSQAILSLGAALPTTTMADFNVHPAQEEAGSKSLFIKQIVTLLILFLLIFGILVSHMYIQKRALYKEATASEKEVVHDLKSRFNQIESSNIARVIEDANEELAKEESTWFAFSSGSRASMLKILLELKSKIDKNSLGFVIDSLTITEGSVIMKASVKDHNALKLLEQALRTSPLFKYVEPQTDTTFEMKITLASPIEKEA